MYRPIDVIKETFQWQDIITDVYERGEGTVVQTRLEIQDEVGNTVCTNYSVAFFYETGGFGGSPMLKSPVKIPDRAPDYELDNYIRPVQNLLYRLMGDANLVHVDPKQARKMGYEMASMQELCSFGFACRMAIGALIPEEPERTTRMAAQMASVLFPDMSVKRQIWRLGAGAAYFRFVNAVTGKALLDWGVFEWK